jgi:hypothetical protein
VHRKPSQPFGDPQGRKLGFRPSSCNWRRATYWVAHSPKEAVLPFLSPPFTSMANIVLPSSSILMRWCRNYTGGDSTLARNVKVLSHAALEDSAL